MKNFFIFYRLGVFKRGFKLDFGGKVYYYFLTNCGTDLIILLRKGLPNAY
jgi:hypothetical protein